MYRGGNLSRFVRSSGIFFLGNILSKIISFFLLPIYTRYIAVDDMGYYDVSVAYTNMAISVVFFEIWSAVLRYMYDKDTVEGKYSAAKSGGTIFLASALVYAAGFTFFGSVLKISHWELIALQGFAQCAVSFYTFSARGLNHNVDFAVSGILSVLTSAGVNILLIVYYHKGFTAMYYGYIISALVQIIYLEMRTGLFRGVRKTIWDKAETGKMLLYALPLCVNTVSYWAMTGFNRLAVNWLMGNSANGILAIGNKFGTLITLVTTCFTYAWQDLSFSKAKDTDTRSEFYSQACNTYARFLFCGMLLLIPVCHIAFNIMITNPVYAEAESTIPLFLLVSVLSAISTFIGNVFYAVKDTKTIFFSTITSALINMAIVFPAIKLWGMNGANIAACVGFICNTLIRTIILHKKIGFAFNYTNLAVLLIAFCASFFVFQAITNSGAVLLLAVTTVFAAWIFRKEIAGITKKSRR